MKNLELNHVLETPHGKIKNETIKNIFERAIEIAEESENGKDKNVPTNTDTIDREPCEFCGGEKKLYQNSRYENMYMNTFGKRIVLETEFNKCPPFADCCNKDVPVESSFKIEYCPNCGRPLTDEAWAKLEKRLRG